MFVGDVQKSILKVLQHIHTYTWTLQSDDARNFAWEVSVCSYVGFISTEIVPGIPQFGRRWKITAPGLSYLTTFGDLIAEDELAHYQARHSDVAQ